jgi:hypothetical protein
MTLEPRMLAVEERLQRMASGMPSPDVDAGWAAISAQLEPTLARVIPLRRRRLGRPIALAAAAALLVAGSALAAVTRGGADGAAGSPVVAFDGGVLIGPHLHAAFSGPSVRDTSAAPPSGAAQPVSHGSPTSDGSDAPRTGHDGKAQDDPHDRDQGTGNDGRHDDNGGGNDGAEGTQPHGKADGHSPAPSDPPADHGPSDHAHANAGGDGHGH